MQRQIQILGMVWYKPEHFDRLMGMFEDRDKLHGTYAQWLAAAEHGYRLYSSQGTRVVRVCIDPDQFAEWCKAKGANLDSTARNAFVNEVAYRLATGADPGAECIG